MIVTLRELQAPLLALILLGACAFKLSRVLRSRSLAAVLDATALFPERLRRPATAALSATELTLGVGLLVTMGPLGTGGRADAVRLATAVFFLVGMCALVELRERRPDLGCGCFGDLSTGPAGVRTVIRAGLLAGMALAALRLRRPFAFPPPGSRAAVSLALLAAELVVLALVSPELGEVLVRLGYAEPCEVRQQPPHRPLTALRRSRSWRQHAGVIMGGPADMWRELCWWYVVYPALSGGQDCQVVFAVEVRHRRPAIRAAVVRPAPGPPAAPAPSSGVPAAAGQRRPAHAPSGTF